MPLSSSSSPSSLLKGQHTTVTSDCGRPRDGGIKRPRFEVGGLGWNACPVTYSTFPAHVHVNWANSSTCVCYKEDERGTAENSCLSHRSEGNAPGGGSVEGETRTCRSLRCLSSSALLCGHLSRLRTKKLSFFIKHVLKTPVNHFSWHSTQETDLFQPRRVNWVDTALGVGGDLCSFSGSF